MDDWYATVVSPDDGHIVARNVYRKEINILRKIMHQVGYIYKIMPSVGHGSFLQSSTHR